MLVDSTVYTLFENIVLKNKFVSEIFEMKQSLQTKHGPLLYTVSKRKRQRSIRLRIMVSGAVSVTTPFRVKQSVVEEFIGTHTDWIFEKVGAILQNEHPMQVHEYFTYIESKSKKNHVHYVEKKQEALQIIKREVERVNTLYGFIYKDVRVKNQKTRWGSCSKQGVLNFNYKVAYLSPEARMYVVAHELCHLKEFNHKKVFWDLVKKAVPEYQRIRKQLKGGDTK